MCFFVLILCLRLSQSHFLCLSLPLCLCCYLCVSVSVSGCLSLSFSNMCRLTYTHMPAHTYMNTQTYQVASCMDAFMHVHAGKHTHLHACTHTCTHTHACTCTHTCTHTHTHYFDLSSDFSSASVTEDRTEILRLDETGMYANIFGFRNLTYNLFPINDGLWHLVVVFWNSATGDLDLTVDYLRQDRVRSYGFRQRVTAK